MNTKELMATIKELPNLVEAPVEVISVRDELIRVGKTLTNDQIEMLIHHGLETTLKDVRGSQLLVEIKKNLRSIYTSWRRESGSTVVSVAFVQPANSSIDEQVSFVKTLVQHDMLEIMHADRKPEKRMVGPSDRLIVVPLNFPFQPTREEVQKQLIDVIEAQRYVCDLTGVSV